MTPEAEKELEEMAFMFAKTGRYPTNENGDLALEHKLSASYCYRAGFLARNRMLEELSKAWRFDYSKRGNPELFNLLGEIDRFREED